jgi:hypothetical protein
VHARNRTRRTTSAAAVAIAATRLGLGHIYRNDTSDCQHADDRQHVHMLDIVEL